MHKSLTSLLRKYLRVLQCPIPRAITCLIIMRRSYFKIALQIRNGVNSLLIFNGIKFIFRFLIWLKSFACLPIVFETAETMTLKRRCRSANDGPYSSNNTLAGCNRVSCESIFTYIYTFYMHINMLFSRKYHYWN